MLFLWENKKLPEIATTHNTENTEQLSLNYFFDTYKHFFFSPSAQESLVYHILYWTVRNLTVTDNTVIICVKGQRRVNYWKLGYEGFSLSSDCLLVEHMIVMLNQLTDSDRIAMVNSY